MDEILAEAVRKYPVIYDKGKKGHKDRTMVLNAWKAVVQEAGLEDVATAQRLFGNLKKRFNKRRRNSKGVSGSGLADVAQAKERLKELHFLAWLEPHVSLRETKSNCPDFRELLNSLPTECDDQQIDIEVNVDNDNEEDESDESSSDKENEEPIQEDLIFTPPPSKTLKVKKRPRSATTNKEKWHQERSSLEEAQIGFFKSAEQIFQSEKEKTNNSSIKEIDEVNSHFGKFIACEIDQLPKKYQRIARHNMSSVLFEVQNKVEQESFRAPQAPSIHQFNQFAPPCNPNMRHVSPIPSYSNNSSPTPSALTFLPPLSSEDTQTYLPPNQLGSPVFLPQ